jgi:predicted RecB family nuclease
MFFATHVANFLACQHIATLDRLEAAGEVAKPFFKDPTIELLRKLGLEHEKAYLRRLTERKGLSIVEISEGTPRTEAAAVTAESMRGGVDLIYQATLQDGLWGGRADFLLRVDTPSALGSWSYEAVETKLARSAKAGAVIQLCFYSDLIARIQGVEPRWMHVVLGGGAEPERLQVQRYIAYFRKVRREFEEAWKVSRKTYPEPVEHCYVCSWSPVCDKRWRDDDYLSLVAGITRNQRKALNERDVNTVLGLATLTLPVKPKIERIGGAALFRIREQARLQVEGREAGRLVYELLGPVEPERGLAALPLPSKGDVFLDLESDPYVLGQGLEYLIGMVSLPEDGAAKPAYESLWSFDRAEEKKAFETFIAKVMDRWRQYPDMRIYHYASYEPSAIKRLAGRHGKCVEDVDQLLRSGVFVDLYRVVRQGLRASVESYSIKRIEPLYGFFREVPLQDANLALQAFGTVLALGDGQQSASELRKAIQGYNRDDCLSALELRRWLEDRRRDLEAASGQAVPRPSVKSGEPAERLSDKLEQVAAVVARLVDGLPPHEAEWTKEQRARWLLAQMLEWHRREEKSAWWEYYRLCGLTDEELQEDKNALGGLVYVGEVDWPKRSIIYCYRFPPQEHTVDRASEVRDPKTGKSAGQLVSVDDRNLTIDIKRSKAWSGPHPTALIPFDIVPSGVLSDSLLRLGTWVAEHGITGPGSFQAARDLLLRQPPCGLRDAGKPLVDDDKLTEYAKGVVLSLSQQASTLPIQGPPGSGKTFTGARMIPELVKQGRRVGITAGSHKVISNLLHGVCETAQENCIALRVVQKPNDDDGCEHGMVLQAEDNQTVLDELTAGRCQVAAGSVWLWARADMANSVDVLFVDEAGQMSLANVLAISQATRSIVLLGDPQQLDQPQRGVHPPGANVSALAHLLNGRATIALDQGLFLTETYRLHPDICAFTSELFYDGRLMPRPENAKQHLNALGALDGTGLRFVPVEHSGNQNESPEEVAKVAELIERLLQAGTTWTDKRGKTIPLKLEHILVVAAYNAQVSALAARLPTGARVGTVDKFQGQQAPVVFYSMATSTPEDAPRGMEFLYSLNRLNVATSRAQCVSVIVASPALFQVQCKTPHQIELVNAFCRYVEMSQTI